ncbi:hypothetical protein ACFOPX_01220 [Helicobacter baculiformis]|uniref:Outer membrane protein n=1 Tax=Helicobacter baculiformis TaxID=427351 RepID=A0ABV7ZID2_9HELI|nr:hypothetical protein [Helicobacter baculiformis]
MGKLKLYQGLSICLCVSLSPLAGDDIRNGFFFGAGFGAKNEVLSAYQDAPAFQNVAGKPASGLFSKYADLLEMVQHSNVTSLQAALNKDLQALVAALDALNTEVAKVGVDGKSLKGLASVDVGKNTGKCDELQARIEAEIQALGAMADVTGTTETAKANQEVIKQYSDTLKLLAGFEKDLMNEVQSYNQQLASSNKAYQQAQSVYQKEKQEYDKGVAKYMTVRNDLVNHLKGIPARHASVDSAVQIYRDLNALVNADPHYRGGKPKVGYYMAMNEGASKVIKVGGLGGAVDKHSFGEAFSGLLAGLHVSKDLHDLDLLKLVACETWYVDQLREIQKLKDANRVAYLKGQLSDAYNTDSNIIQQVHTGDDYRRVIPTADSVFKAPTAPDDKFSFHYQNYATSIKDADTMATIKAVAGMPTQQSAPSAVHASLGSFVDTINGASKFYSNVGYNANVITGYQHFFSRRLGFSLQASAGYEWIQSPLFQKSPLFNRMQGARVALGGDLLYDFKAPATQSGLYCGLFAGLFGTNSHYFLTTKALQTYWKYSFNVHWNAGLRFQLGSNIVKLGVSSPLIPRVINLQAGSTHFLVHETFHNFNFYASYTVLFGHS